MRSRWAAPSTASALDAARDVPPRHGDAAWDRLVAAPVRDVAFAVVDLETTGLFVDRGNRVCQIAVIALDPDGEGAWRASATFSSLLDPRRELSAGARRACGTGADAPGAPTLAALAPRLLPLLDGRVLVIHNAPFGITFLRSELEPLGFGLGPRLVVDVVGLARAYLPGPLSLAEMTVRIGLPPCDAPLKAARDAHAVRGILMRVLAMLGPEAPLSRLFPAHARHGLRAPDPFGPVRLSIEDALQTGADLAIRYYSPWNARITERRVRPMGVEEELYLDAYCCLRGDRRRFRIDRIRKADVLALS